MLTERENYLRLLDGEIPEFVPKYKMMEWSVHGNPFGGKRTPEGYLQDEYGMLHEFTTDGTEGFFPVPGIVLLDDILKWRDVIHTPDVESVDWEKVAADKLKNVDRVNNPVVMGCGDYFIKLINFMSFTEGLIALQEEPEECYALMEYLSDYYVACLKKYIQYFKPDVLSLADDVAADAMPFINVETYHNLIIPHHKRLTDIALDAGMRISMHCCGKCDMFAQDWWDIGVRAWEPAQAGNDFVGLKKKFNNKLAIMGGWDSTGPISMPGVSDEEFLAALKEYVDTLAPGGGFAFMARVAKGFGDEEYDRKNKMCDDFYESYAKDWYKNH